MERILKMEGTKCVTMDQCTLGQCDQDRRPVKKPTKWMSNSDFILSAGQEMPRSERIVLAER